MESPVYSLQLAHTIHTANDDYYSAGINSDKYSHITRYIKQMKTFETNSAFFIIMSFKQWIM